MGVNYSSEIKNDFEKDVVKNTTTSYEIKREYDVISPRIYYSSNNSNFHPSSSIPPRSTHYNNNNVTNFTYHPIMSTQSLLNYNPGHSVEISTHSFKSEELNNDAINIKKMSDLLIWMLGSLHLGNQMIFEMYIIHDIIFTYNGATTMMDCDKKYLMVNVVKDSYLVSMSCLKDDSIDRILKDYKWNLQYGGSDEFIVIRNTTIKLFTLEGDMVNQILKNGIGNVVKKNSNIKNAYTIKFKDKMKGLLMKKVSMSMTSLYNYNHYCIVCGIMCCDCLRMINTR